ncbi:unnamed protein product [Vicia faba]|uniref:Uncharacterized protein n=1 Tax=Vicia faba TaxID=3906 RepID=A0AAV0Z7W8_VICFA|nr:unnamed protein product [Vicia faba]
MLKIHLEEENTQRLAVETQLRGSDINTSCARLKALPEDKGKAPDRSAEYEEYDDLVIKLHNWECMIGKKDEMIQNLVLKSDGERTKNLLKETKAWSDKNLGHGPLKYLEIED